MLDDIPILIPDLPSTEQLLPWLHRIEHNKWYTNFGPLVQAFESKLREFFVGHLCTVSSGTAALELALLALNRRRALLPAFTFPATATAIKRCGLQAVFTDVDPKTWLLTPSIARQVLEKTDYDIVIPVATFGAPQPVAAWDKFSEETGIPVLIDAAAAFGSQALGERSIVTFSFHATKPFGIGEGGLVVAKSAEFINTIKKLSNFGFEYGMINQYGSNAKLSEYHAAVGLAQLERWPKIIEQRQKILKIYRHYLLNAIDISLQDTPENHVPAIFGLFIKHKKNLKQKLAHKGIETRQWYYPPLTEHPAFKDVPCFGANGETELKVTKNLSLNVLGLPFHTALTEKMIAYICSTLMELK